MVHHRVAIGLGAADQGAQPMGPIRHVLPCTLMLAQSYERSKMTA
jgi:hypothetical protein